MGDAAHQARKSDHNQGNAFDLTHDPAHGPDCNVLSRLVIFDSRVKYVIWNRHIFEVAHAGKGWQPYHGANPHTKHMHVSIKEGARHNLTWWAWSPGWPETVLLGLAGAFLQTGQHSQNSPQPAHPHH